MANKLKIFGTFVFIVHNKTFSQINVTFSNEKVRFAYTAYYSRVYTKENKSHSVLSHFIVGGISTVVH